MPTYQYACTACSHQLEVVQSFTDEPLTECPECQGRLRKLFNSVGIVFKGPGFYRTDSRASNPESSGSSGKGTSESAGSASSSSDTGSSGSSGSGTSGSGSKKPASSSTGSSSSA